MRVLPDIENAVVIRIIKISYVNPTVDIQRAKVVLQPSPIWIRRVTINADIINTDAITILSPTFKGDKEGRANIGQRHCALGPGRGVLCILSQEGPWTIDRCSTVNFQVVLIVQPARHIVLELQDSVSDSAAEIQHGGDQFCFCRIL